MFYSIFYANKIVKRLQDYQSSILSNERQKSNYSYYINDETKGFEIPKYNFAETQKKLDEITSLIIEIKHKIREVNVSKKCKSGKSPDEIILQLTFLTRKRDKLYSMSNVVPKQISAIGGNNSRVEVQNYDIEEAKKEYNNVCNEILSLQDELNEFNMLNQIKMEIDFETYFD